MLLATWIFHFSFPSILLPSRILFSLHVHFPFFTSSTFLFSLLSFLFWYKVVLHVSTYEMISASRWSSILLTFLIVSILEDLQPCICSVTYKLLAMHVTGVSMIQWGASGRNIGDIGAILGRPNWVTISKIRTNNMLDIVQRQDVKNAWWHSGQHPHYCWHPQALHSMKFHGHLAFSLSTFRHWRMSVLGVGCPFRDAYT